MDGTNGGEDALAGATRLDAPCNRGRVLVFQHESMLRTVMEALQLASMAEFFVQK